MSASGFSVQLTLDKPLNHQVVVVHLMLKLIYAKKVHNANLCFQKTGI